MSMSTADRRITGMGLIGFSALLLVEDRLDPTSGVSFYEAATTHPGLLTASALSLLGSAVLTVPAIGGIVASAPYRGASLARVGGLLALLGALGHTALAMAYLMMRSLAGGDRSQMVAFEDRVNADTSLGIIATVMLLSFGVGLALLAWAAWRADLIGWWGPAVVTAVVVAHAVLPDDLPPVIPFTALAGLAAVFGWLGLRLLTTPDPIASFHLLALLADEEGVRMAAVSIRDLDDSVREKLRIRAARHGRSMEAEMREILTAAVADERASAGLFGTLVDRFAQLGGMDIDLPPRTTQPRAAVLPE